MQVSGQSREFFMTVVLNVNGYRRSMSSNGKAIKFKFMIVQVQVHQIELRLNYSVDNNIVVYQYMIMLTNNGEMES